MFAFNQSAQSATLNALNETGAEEALSPERTSIVHTEEVSSGRMNVLLFYQSLVQQLGKAEKLQVVCAHLFKQLSWALCQDEQEGETGAAMAIKGFIELLKAVKFVMCGQTKVSFFSFLKLTSSKDRRRSRTTGPYTGRVGQEPALLPQGNQVNA